MWLEEYCKQYIYRQLKLLPVRCLSHILGMVQWYHAETPTSNWTEVSYAKKEQYRAWQGSRPRRAVQRSLKRPWNFHSDLPLPSRGNPTHWLQPPNETSLSTPAQHTIRLKLCCPTAPPQPEQKEVILQRSKLLQSPTQNEVINTYKNKKSRGTAKEVKNKELYYN